MEIKITKRKENPLLGRKELEFTLRHEGATTPSRTQVRQLVAGELGSKVDGIVVDHMASEYGLGVTNGTARAYPNAEAARALERVHLLKRNALYVEKAKKGEKADKGEKKGA